MKKEYEPPTCDLRKPCEFCHKPFGRKLRQDSRGNGVYLVTMSVWKNTRTCSTKCRDALHLKKETERKQQLETDRKLAAECMDRFLYPGLRR